MRTGHNNGFALSQKGNVKWLDLGADCTAEHEWGIKEIRRDFGMADEGYGVEKRIIRQVPGSFLRVEGTSDNKAWTGFALRSLPEFLERQVRWCTFGDGSRTLWTAWDSRSFAAVSCDPKEQKYLAELYDCVQKLDTCILLGGGGIFQNAGLKIAIKSRLPTETLRDWEKADRDREKLKKDAAATGIEEKLRAAGKRWFALSPMRAQDGSIKFWLNPYEQGTTNYGAFTVKELEDWIQDRGPIPKKREKRRFY